MVVDVDSVDLETQPNPLPEYPVERSCPIFNYVNRSSGVLRKVRLGQRLDTALHYTPTPLVLPKHQKFQDKLSRTPGPVSLDTLIYRDAVGRPNTSSETSLQHSISLPERLGALSAIPYIRYGCPVQFQSEDGDYLLVENDGTLCKVPFEFHNDPRTLLTIFPVDPQSSTVGKKCVKEGEDVFIVQGAAPTYSRQGAVYADSRQLNVRNSAKREVCRRKELLSSKSISKNSDAMATTIWRLKISCPDSHRHIGDTPNTSYSKPHSFRSGESSQLVQQGLQLCYDLPVRSSLSTQISSISNAGTDLIAAQSPQADHSQPVHESFSLHKNNQSITPILPASRDVWLLYSRSKEPLKRRSTASLPYSSKWVIHDVEYQRERTLHQHRKSRRPCPRQPLTPVTFEKRDSRSSHDASLPNKILKHHADPGLDDASDRSAEEYDEVNQVNKPHGFDKSSRMYQHRAALIISRFFRSVCRRDNAADHARKILCRRWRERHPEKYRSPLFELTHHEQLQVLQLYNPHLYGSQHPISPLSVGSPTTRLSRVPQIEQRKRIKQQQVLARMGQETALLNETSRQKVQTPLSATMTLHDMYQRQPLESRERLKTRMSRERPLHSRETFTSTNSP